MTTSIVAAGLATPYRFTVHDYHAMIDAGILGEGDHVELIEGEILQMAPFNPPHPACIDVLNMRLAPALAGRAIVRVQSSFRIAEHSEPEPDMLILRPRHDFYGLSLPGPGDTLLAIEVAETSLRYDRIVKARLYAQADIPEYWLVNVITLTVTVFRDPSPEGYRQVIEASGADRLSPLAFPDISLAVAGLFPGRA